MAENNNISSEPQGTPTQPAQNPKNMVHTWAMLCHLAALAIFIGIPFGNIIGPLVVWLVKKQEHPFIDEQGKAAVNFQISMTIYLIAAFFLCFVFIGFPILIGLLITNLIFIIVASVKASNGESYKYPLAIRFIK